MTAVKKLLFWCLSLTWGAVMTLVGGITAVILIAFKNRPHTYNGLVYFELGQHWGGINLGPFFIISRGASDAVKAHEAGHGVQNIILGPFMPIVIGIPSLIRSNYRKYLVKSKRCERNELKPYDSIWFEGWATKIGNKVFNSSGF